MAKSSRTASKALRHFEGLVISTGSKVEPQLARRALRRAGLSGWSIRPLAPGALSFFATPPRGGSVTTSKAWQLTYLLRNDRDVERAEPAFETIGHDALATTAAARSTRGSLFRETHLPSSTPHDWAIQLCNVRGAWSASAVPPGKGVVVGHPDTGYTDHPQLDARALKPGLGYNFYENVPSPKDLMTGGSAGHGTSTGSVIVSADDPAVIGVSPSATLVPMRVNDSVIHFSWRRLCEALYWAVNKKFHVVSMSLGGPWGGSGTLEDAVRTATQNGLILVSAAGNKWPSVVYPACFPEVIATAACNADSAPWSGSSNGPEVDITAPGESVWRALTSENSQQTIDRSSGTSYAAAHVAGMCALWIAHNGGWNALCKLYGPAGVGGVFKEALQSSAKAPRGWDTQNFGPGIADAHGLLVSRAPTRAPARGARVASRYKAPGPWERIEAFFPLATSDQVRAEVLSAFAPSERRVSRRLEPVLDELNFQIATDPALREAIRSRLPGSRDVRTAGVRRGIRIAGASTELGRRLAN
jgi:thermitase